MTTATRMSGDELLDTIKPTKRSADTWVCLSGDLLDAHETESAKLEAMTKDELAKSAQRLSAGGAVSAAVKAQARKVKKLEEEIEAKQMRFVFENMTPDERSELAAAHPPRKGDQFDQLTGYNRDAVGRESVRMCMVEPQFSDAGWMRLLEVIPPGEWAELQATCDRANGRVSALPKSQLAATLLRARNGTSSSSPSSGG